nr:MAK10-like protein [Tanacetum cinerariifolium]
MTLEQIKEKFIPVWKQMEDFVPMSSKEESERVKIQGLKIDQGSSKRVKISKSVSEGVSGEELKGMMQLVPLEEVYIKALQQFDKEDLHQLWTLVKETFSIKQATRDKEKELWVELKRLFEPDSEDRLWIHHQGFMHDPLNWKLYDTCGVHHESLLGHILYRTPWPIKGVLRRTIDQSACSKLHDRNAEESWALLEDLALYDNESWNDPSDFAKPIKAISLPQDVPSTSDHRLIKLENQVQRLMEAHLAPKQPVQVNKISSLCEICSGPHDAQYCMKNSEQAFFKYASSHTNKEGEFVCTKRDDRKVMFIEIIKKYADSRKEEHEVDENAKTGELEVEYFDIFPSRNELAIKGMHVFVGNFTYVIDFMIVEDISSIIDLRLSQVLIRKPFVEISNMTHDPPKGVVRFTNRTDEISYKIPHKIEQYNSLSDLEREHTKSFYLRTEENKRRGVKYVMTKILGFYKECMDLGPEYLTGISDEGEVT